MCVYETKHVELGFSHVAYCSRPLTVEARSMTPALAAHSIRCLPVWSGFARCSMIAPSHLDCDLITIYAKQRHMTRTLSSKARGESNDLYCRVFTGI